MEPTLQAVVHSSLQWIFVGGKGGVGKTTTSCALATLLASSPYVDPNTKAERPRKVLLVSTDPAHNLSDAFNQQLGKTPTPIKGLEQTLWAMEIDRARLIKGETSIAINANHATTGNNTSNNAAQGAGGSNATSTHTASDNTATAASSGNFFNALMSIVKEAAGSLPGLDELAVFTEILRQCQASEYDVVLFDTAPTGHTLQLLSMPDTLDTLIGKFTALERGTPILQMANTVLGAVGPSMGMSCAGQLSADTIRTTLTTWHEQIKAIHTQFSDPSRTCFICVCIPEFLSVYETERLVQELMKHNIGCDSIVVNQLVLKPSSEPPCRMCAARQRVQARYLSQIEDLYEDFHLVKMPLLQNEVRGVSALRQFARFLCEPYNPDVHGYLEIESC